VTVGGHVDVGETYEVAALREIQEETGMVVEKEDLRLLAKIRQSNADPLTQTISNYFCSVFAFCFRGDISSLVIESGKAIEFVEKDAEELRRLTSENAGDYSFGLYQKQFMPIWDELAKL
jgi:ADP-ribose pyrophosphatase YjhB (NUDIX family)